MGRKWIVVVIIVLLVGVFATLAGFYWQKSAKLEEDLATMGLNFSSLQKVKSGQDELISRMSGELETAEAQVSTLQAELEAAQAEISRLEAELEAAED
jgi:peptidoglycan hydrolase CwlO-like protein